MDKGSSFPGGEKAGAWTWPLTSSSAEVKFVWSYTRIHTYIFAAWFLVTNRVNIHGVVLSYEQDMSSWRGT
jgi:hypothetical protein